MNDISASHAELPRSRYLNNSLRRARTAAEQRSHRYVTLEHLLYALLDDPDALNLLEASGADVAAIRGITSDAIDHRMSSLVVPNGRAPSFSYKFDSLILSASSDAIRLGRREIDGALAVIAIAKDPESNASAFLTANGFYASSALNYLSSPKSAHPIPGNQAQITQRPSNSRYPEITLSPTKNDEVDDVLASVRNLLEAGERRERGLPPAMNSAPKIPHSQPRTGQLPALPGSFPPVGMQAGTTPREQPRQESRPHQHQTGVQSFKNEPSLRGGQPERKHGALHAKLSGASVARLIEHIPKKMRTGVPQTVEVRLSKEETLALFEGVKGRGPSRPQVARAVTIKLLAPEDGFFVEALTAETQWIFDRPGFLGEEAYGSWVYAVVPHRRGKNLLCLQISSRDMDETGVAKDLTLPEQAVEIRVRANYWRALGGFLRTLFLLAAGGAITEGGLYFLKMIGRIPHMPWQ